MPKATPQEARGWLEMDNEDIEKRLKRIAAGDIDQSAYHALSLFYACRARAKYYHQEGIAAVRADFKNAAEAMEQSFKMVYDNTSPHYIGDDLSQVTWGDVNEVSAVEMMSRALISADFDYATAVAKWPRLTQDDDPAPMEVHNYVYGLRDTLLGDIASAEKLLAHTLAKYQTRPPQKNDFRRNYYTMTKALMGIIREDETLFNQGLDEQLESHRKRSKGLMKDTDEEYFCDNALALANLGRYRGLTITVSSDYLPADVLINASS